MGISVYTKERLEEAAGSSRTLSEALGKLGVSRGSSAYPSSEHQVTGSMAVHAAVL